MHDCRRAIMDSVAVPTPRVQPCMRAASTIQAVLDVPEMCRASAVAQAGYELGAAPIDGTDQPLD